MSGNVQLIDPLNANVPSYLQGGEKVPIFKTGIPPYEDMQIYVNLVAERRGRTVLETNTIGLKTSIVESDLNQDVTINFLGQNQNKDQYDTNSFTTKYYDGSVPDGIQHDSFGITSIKTLINSSYIPQIDIEFTDVRGLAFFNRADSPYRILFDFPPPIFHLTLKGYYGKALQYQMHLVKYTTEFKSDSGNYVINAKFIAISYAPLTDILFRYVLNFGLLRKKEDSLSVTIDNTPPKTTFELIRKLETLYDVIKTEITDTKENEEYETLVKKEEKLTSIFSYLNDYNTTLRGKNEVDESDFVPILFTYNSENTENYNDIRVLTYFNEYNGIILDEGTTPEKRLHLGYLINNTRGEEETFDQPDYPDKVATLQKTLQSLKTKINNELGEELITEQDINNGRVTEIISSGVYGNVSNVLPAKYVYPTGKDLQPDTVIYVWYLAADISNLYVKLYERKGEIEFEKNGLSTTLNDKINALVAERLGMLPTIYNIFKIILDDVDHFFNVMRKTANDAEVDHNVPSLKKQILAGSSDIENINDKIYAFPLVFEVETICGGQKKTRVAPTRISDALTKRFPEMELVDEFIKSFFLYTDIVALVNAKTLLDSSGNVKWIPCNPSDSNLVSKQSSSPYIGIDNPFSTAVNTSDKKLVNQILNIFLERYYIAAQYTMYKTNQDRADEKYYEREIAGFEEIYANGEGINLANSIVTKNLAEALITAFKPFRDNTSSFIQYLEANKAEFVGVYPLPEETEFLEVAYGPELYADKRFENYEGLDIVRSVNLRSPNSDTKDPINLFLKEEKEEKKKWYQWGKNKNSEKLAQVYDFLDSNLIYFEDGTYDTKTRYVINNYKSHHPTTVAYHKFISTNITSVTKDALVTTFVPNFDVVSTAPLIDDCLNRGHIAITENFKENSENNPMTVESFEDNDTNNTDLPAIWSQSLTEQGEYIYNDMYKLYGDGTLQNKENRFIRSLLYASHFGFAISPFVTYPLDYNGCIFSIAGVSEVPYSMAVYIGALVDINGTQNLTNLLNIFKIVRDKPFDSSGIFIFADIHDIDEYLSRKDKDTFKSIYEDFISDEFNDIDREMITMYTDVTREYDKECAEIDKSSEAKEDRLKSICRADLYYSKLEETDNVFRILNDKIYVVIYSPITFHTEISNSGDAPLQHFETLENSDNNQFLDTFFDRAIKELQKKITDLDERADKFDRDVNDHDIINQTYYSFKNINDKWLAGLNQNTSGYPFKNKDSDSLIQQFAFVDRAMNPIGDTILNTQILLDAEKDPDVSIFTVLTQLLSVNGFEFFPLQNFMSFENNEWEESFAIDTTPIKQQFPTFVCMYLGGASSYPSGGNNEFEDDGIISLDEEGLPDFNTTDCETDETLDNQKNENSDFPYSRVKAFKVKFGEQNQSMFKDIQIDSKEYPETNESIQILSQISGDGQDQAPIPKGQNLYNLYENRSYKATITGLGNVMIQPTQYFQLENVPLFNGAYVILEVIHVIQPNKMVTSFSGTKLLKYPMPRVTQPATFFGFAGGSSDNSAVYDTVLEGTGTANNPDVTKYNEFYYLKI